VDEVEVAVPVAVVELPEDEPEPLAATVEGVEVGAGDATSREGQIKCQEEIELKIHTSRNFDLEIGALRKHLARIGRRYERDLITCPHNERHIGHGK
jgi:hypothetical protein